MALQASRSLRTALLTTLSLVQALRAQLKEDKVEVHSVEQQQGQVSVFPWGSEDSDLAPDQQAHDDRPCTSTVPPTQPQAASIHGGQTVKPAPGGMLQHCPGQPPTVTCQPDSPSHSTKPLQQHSHSNHNRCVSTVEKSVVQQAIARKPPTTPPRIGMTAARISRPQPSNSPVLGKHKAASKTCAVRSGIDNLSLKAAAAASRSVATPGKHTPGSPVVKSAVGTPTAQRQLLSLSSISLRQSLTQEDAPLCSHVRTAATAAARETGAPDSCGANTAAPDHHAHITSKDVGNITRKSVRNSTPVAISKFTPVDVRNSTPVAISGITPLGVKGIAATGPCKGRSHLQSCGPSELRAFLASHIVARHNALYDCEQEESPEPQSSMTTVAALLQGCGSSSEKGAVIHSPTLRPLLRSMDFDLVSPVSSSSQRGRGVHTPIPRQPHLLRASVDTTYYQ